MSRPPNTAARPSCVAIIVWMLLLAGAPKARADAPEAAAHAVVERVLGAAAAGQITMTLLPSALRPDGYPVERFVVSGTAGHIRIDATSISALTEGAGWYLKSVAHADLVLRGARPLLPAVLPAPAAPIERTASVPHRYAFNDTNADYTDPNLSWEGWENELDLIALHGINEIHVTVGTDAVYHELLQRYGYGSDELRRWIPDPAHQLGWLLQTMSGGDFPISAALLDKRAALGRRIADRARELGITPVLPGYWGTVPADFAARNPGADVIAQDLWVGYQRPGWLNPATPLFQRVAADYYEISARVLGPSTMYKMDPLHEGGVLGRANLTSASAAIMAALQAARPGATWVLIAWMVNPSPDLLRGIADKSRLLLLATEADAYPTWDSALRWPGVPYALGSIYSYGGRTIVGGNAATIVERWFADLAGPNAAALRGIAIFPESWTTNPVMAELLSELPWQPRAFVLSDWMRDYAVGRYGTPDPHAMTAWSLLATTAYGAPPNGIGEGNDSLFAAQPGLSVGGATCCYYERMRYSAAGLEAAWRELADAAPGITQQAAYRFDLADLTRQVIVNRARVLLPLIRRAHDRRDSTSFEALAARWLQLMDLADRVEGTDVALMLGPHLDNARANATTPAEQAQFVRNALNLVTNWGTRAGYDAGLRDYANRDWNCLTSGHYRVRWSRYFDGLREEIAGRSAPPIDWFATAEDFANGLHPECASAPTGDIVALAGEVRAVLDGAPEASSIPAGWSSYAENDAILRGDGTTFSIDTAGADTWLATNRFGALYRRLALRDGGGAIVRVASLASEAGRVSARAGLIAGGDLVDAHPSGFVTLAATVGGTCQFAWAADAATGLSGRTERAFGRAALWLRLERIGATYVGSCSPDGVDWTIVGSASPGALGDAADIGMFATAANGGASDRAVASFDRWSMSQGTVAASARIAIEYRHERFAHHFVTAATDEIAKLDAGVFEGWTRTGLGFQVFTEPGADRVPVCRFFTVAFPPTSSHFYAPRGLGCEAALANRDWQYEGDVFYAALPDAAGACPSETVPVYRLYNNGQGGAPNHRFTTSAAVRSSMIADGYVAEGRGVGVGLCARR